MGGGMEQIPKAEMANMRHTKYAKCEENRNWDR